MRLGSALWEREGERFVRRSDFGVGFAERRGQGSGWTLRRRCGEGNVVQGRIIPGVVSLLVVRCGMRLRLLALGSESERGRRTKPFG